MQSVLKYIKEYYKAEFNVYYFILILLLMGTLIYLNYWHFLERKYAGGGRTRLSNFIGYYCLYFIPFAAAFLLQLLFYKDCNYYYNKWFWFILFIAPAIFSFRINFDAHEILIKQFWSGAYQNYWERCIGWIVRVLLVLLCIYVVWLIKDRNVQSYYGVKKLDSIKPYLIMLLIMLPLLALAGTQQDFLQMYPRAKFLQYSDFAVKKWHYIFYELCYGFDFVSIEFFFRGFLVLSLLNICGTHCLVPIACFYCSIHFGKPMGEAISSFWGGLLLGIVSYNSQSIWGGLMVHLGIAWLMEISGWLGSLFFLPKK